MLTGAHAQTLGGVGGIYAPLVIVGVAGLQIVDQVGHVLLGGNQAVGEPVGVGVGGGGSLGLLVVQTAQYHGGLGPGGGGAAVEVAVLIPGEQALGVAVGHRHLIVGGDGAEVLDQQLREHQAHGVGGLPTLDGGQVVHDLGHVIAADLTVDRAAVPGPGGGVVLAHGGAAEQVVGVGHVHVGPPPVGGAPLGFYLVGIEQVAHHGDELGVGQLLLRPVLVVSNAGDQAVVGGLGDVGISPVGGGHVRKGGGRRRGDGQGAQAQGKGDGSP